MVALCECMRPGPLAIFGGAVEPMTQAAFDNGPEAELAADAAAGNNKRERAHRPAGNAAHVTEDTLKTALHVVVANFLPRKSLA